MDVIERLRTAAHSGLEGRLPAALATVEHDLASADSSDHLIVLAVALLPALEGSRAGLPVLLDSRGGTNSNIECFYCNAGLLLLGVQIPMAPAARRSVFTDLERLIDDCLQRPPASL